jgi:hypothetical protein
METVHTWEKRDWEGAIYRSSFGPKTESRSPSICAARYGRVECLLVAIGLQVWGRFEGRTGRVTRLGRMEKAEEDLLDDAAGATLFNGGTVYAIPRDEMPEDSPVAAILRYGAAAGLPLGTGRSASCSASSLFP